LLPVAEQGTADTVSPAIQNTVAAAEGRYGTATRSLLEYVRNQPERLITDLSTVETRVNTVLHELPVTRRALDTIDRYLTTADLSVPTPGDVIQAAHSLYAMTAAYEDAHRGLNDDYGDKVPDALSLQQALEETRDEGKRARDEISDQAGHYENDSPSGLYAADHAAVLTADVDEATYGAKLAAEVDGTLRSSPALRNLPDERGTATYVSILSDDLQRVGHERVSPTQLRSDFDKVKDRVAAIENALGGVTTESVQLTETLAKIEQVIGKLWNSPLLHQGA
jgi:hypothetical protein